MARTVGEYVLLFGIGTWLLMVSSILVGYLPYASPGWHAMNVSQRLEGIGFASRFVVGILVPFTIVAGVILCLFGQLLRALRVRGWIMAVSGGIVSALLSGYLLLGLAWYIEMAEWPLYTGILLGAAFGAIRLPRVLATESAQRKAP